MKKYLSKSLGKVFIILAILFIPTTINVFSNFSNSVLSEIDEYNKETISELENPNERHTSIGNIKRVVPVIKETKLSSYTSEKDLKDLINEHREKYKSSSLTSPTNNEVDLLVDDKPEVIPTAGYSNTKSLTNEQSKLEDIVRSLLGVPYVWGGVSPTRGMDCSGFTQYVMRQLGYNIPRVSYNQSEFGQLIPRTSLRIGDLLFFDTRNPRNLNDIKTPTEEMLQASLVEDDFAPNTVSHVGIYVGNGIMAHASSGDGYITYTSLDKSYYRNRFINARRILK